MSPVSHWKQAAIWARSLSDAELVSNLESLRAERVDIGGTCPFDESHPECKCEEHSPVLRELDDHFDFVRLEMVYRRGMTAHEKMARIAAVRTELGVGS
ncbi:MAG: hypothetical protein ACLGIE_07850 [Alphaproteobacteria bacterium]